MNNRKRMKLGWHINIRWPKWRRLLDSLLHLLPTLQLFPYHKSVLALNGNRITRSTSLWFEWLLLDMGVAVLHIRDAVPQESVEGGEKQQATGQNRHAG
jgi:hypothetical protein